MDLDCVSHIGHALDFLAFSADINLNNNIGIPKALNDSQSKSLQASLEESKTGSLAKKYMKLTNQTIQYAQTISKKLLNILVALFIENTFKPLIIENSTMILNILFSYGDQETYIKVIKTLLDYIPRYWVPIIGPQNPAEPKEAVQTVAKEKSSNVFWKALAGKKKEEPKKVEAGYKVPKTKETEAFLDGLHGYMKAMVLVVLQKIPVQDSYRLSQFLGVIEMNDGIVFDEKQQEMAFFNCLLYILFPILLK